MSIIESCYKELDCFLNNKESKEQLFNRCVRDKLEKVYSIETEEFDLLLEQLESGINFNSVTQVKICVTKILRLLSHNRKFLVNTLRRLY